MFLRSTKEAWSPITLFVSPKDKIEGHALDEVSDNNNSVLKSNAEFSDCPKVTVLFNEPILIPNILMF